MNKNNFITLVIFTILIPTLVFGQACLQNGITLSSQQDVDLFKSFYPNCVEIQGDLCINGFGISTGALSNFGK